MSDKIILPPQVQEEISLYLAGDETILEAIPSTTGSVGKLGELWMLLTDRNVLFYTCEHKKDPVVALIGRRDLQSISYESHPSGVTLTFISIHRPQHPTRIAFLRAQRPLVNRFCEILSKDVSFEVVGGEEQTETSAKTPPVEGSKPASEKVPPVAAEAAAKPSSAPAPSPSTDPSISVEVWGDGNRAQIVPDTASAASATPTPASKTIPERIVEVIPPPPQRPPDVRIATSLSGKPAASSGSLKTASGANTSKETGGMPAGSAPRPRPEPSQPSTAERVPPQPAPKAAPIGTAAKPARPEEPTRVSPANGGPATVAYSEVRFVVFSTLIALLVGFIWYRLFEAIGETRPRR